MNTGCRIPCDYVVVSGAGQTSSGSSSDHWETGAYDIALLDAGIENFNVMEYTSVLPLESNEISWEDAQQYFHHGAVLETIKAQMNGTRGQVLCSGVGRMWVKHHGKRIGGFAAEFEGNCSERVAIEALTESLEGIFERRYGGKQSYEIEDMKFDTRELIVDEEFGTVFVAICFLNYIYPQIEEE